MTADANSTSPPIRWGLAFAILVIGNLLTMLVWTFDFSRQERVFKSAAVILFTGALLFLWAVFFSRFRARTRFRIFLLGLLSISVGASCLRIKGVNSDFVPIIEFRWQRAAITPSTTTPATMPY